MSEEIKTYYAGENTTKAIVKNLKNSFASIENTGYNTTVEGDYANAEGSYTAAIGDNSHAEGSNGFLSERTVNSSEFSGLSESITVHGSKAKGASSHAEGVRTLAYGDGSHSEGKDTNAFGTHSHAEGYDTKATGNYSHAEGASTESSGTYSHSEGSNTTASGNYSHAEGYDTESSGNYSHAEGDYSKSSGEASHAEGYETEAKGDYSHSEGRGTIAGSEYQHVEGKHNIEDVNNVYAHIVGNGATKYSRSNAHTLDWSGNAWFAGNIKVGGTGQDDTNAVAVATKTQLDALDRDKADNIRGVYYGICESSSSTVGKYVDLYDATGFELTVGAVVIVKFTASNGASNPTLNVNGTGAKPIFRYSGTRVSTNTSSTGWKAGAVQMFVYDGTGWIRDFWENSTYTLSSFSVNATSTELNYCSGVTSNIQDQLNNRSLVRMVVWGADD